MTNPSNSKFVHLHLHSEYSLLDGANRISRLVDRVKELGMDAVAVTDHGNLHGAIEFYTKATAAGIKPILGIEAYVAPGDRTDKTHTGVADGGFHLVLLAENITGWKNLLKLSSDAFLNGFYYKPRMDKTTLTQWADGLIAINGHLGSSIAHHLLHYTQTNNDAHYQAAVDEAKWHAECFGKNENGDPRFFVELQRHDTADQDRINPLLIKLAKELDLPLVADNDAHFLLAEDYDVHDTLCCISMAKDKESTDRLKYPTQIYVKSPDEMAALFTDVPEAIENTVLIADRCNVELDFTQSHAPVVKVEYIEHDDKAESSEARGSTEWFINYCSQFKLHPFDSSIDNTPADVLKVQCDKALRQLSLAGLVWRYGEDGITDEINKRLDRELGILADKSISAYFLIVWDVVNWARQRGIPAMARGSGVGTMVGYVLGLSNACPIRYGLLFERFTDPDRSEYPDIDIDICQDGRAHVIDYVREKYGHVAQIITFGRLKAKAAIKDVARVMGLTPREGQRLSNLVPSELNITIEAALEKEPDFKKEYEENKLVRRVVDSAIKLEGHARHAGVHAAGVVIATQPLDTILPLYRASGSDDIVTQWDGPTCEKVGLLKMDFLGLRTLSTIERAKKLVYDTLPEKTIWDAVGRSEGNGAHPMDLERLNYDDSKVFELFQRGDTAGVFQFESGGMRRLLAEMQPDQLEDLIAANALFRPGPMELIPNYNMRKHGKEQVPKVHEIVDKYTAQTHGIMVYQEQVMQILHGLGDIPLRRAYTLIKAISKKNGKIIDAERSNFVLSAQKKGLSKKQSQKLYDLILKFAGYGFNKSHSTGYAIIAYQTAYLKTYFPNQYMAALLTFESAAKKVENWVGYLEDCRQTIFADSTKENPHVGVEVKPPDVNLSEDDFTIVFDEGEQQDSTHGHVRFGLNAIRGSGSSAVGAIVAERKANGAFKSIFNFCERVELGKVNRATIETLVKGGAFDSLHGVESRSAVFSAIGDAISSGQKAAADKRDGQLNIFASFLADTPEEPAAEPPLPKIKAWDETETLAFEKGSLGFHVSGHPLDQYEEVVKRHCTCSIAEANELPNATAVKLAGTLSQIRVIIIQRGKRAGDKMARLMLQDKTGSMVGVVFTEPYEKHVEILQNDAVVLVEGKLDRSRGELNLMVDKVVAIEEVASHYALRLELNLVENKGFEALEQSMHTLEQLLHDASNSRMTNGGPRVDVMLHVYTQGKRVSLKPHGLKVVAGTQLIGELNDMLGQAHVYLAH